MVRPHSGAVAPVTGSAAATRAAGKERRRRIRGVSLVAGWQGETGLASEPAVLGSSGAGLDALTSWPAAARSGGEQWRRAAGGEERRGRLPWAPSRTSLHPDLLFFCLVSQCTSMVRYNCLLNYFFIPTITSSEFWFGMLVFHSSVLLLHMFLIPFLIMY